MRIKRTKILTLALAVLMILALAACGNSSTPNGTTTPSAPQSDTPNTQNPSSTPAIGVESPSTSTNNATAQDEGLYVMLIPHTKDDKFVSFNSISIGFYEHWDGEVALKETDITDFIVYINGSPNKVPLSNMVDAGSDNELKTKYRFDLGTSLDQYPAVYSISLNLFGKEYTQDEFRTFKINDDKSTEVLPAGTAPPVSAPTASSQAPGDSASPDAPTNAPGDTVIDFPDIDNSLIPDVLKKSVGTSYNVRSWENQGDDRFILNIFFYGVNETDYEALKTHYATDTSDIKTPSAGLSTTVYYYDWGRIELGDLSSDPVVVEAFIKK